MRFTTIQEGTQFILEDKNKREEPFIQDFSLTIKQAFVVYGGITSEEERNDVYYCLAIRSYILKLRAKVSSVSIKDMNEYVSNLLADAIKGDEVKVLTKGPDDSINVIDLLSAEKIEELRKRNPPLVFVEIIKNFWCVPSRNPGSIIFSSPKSIPRSFAIFLSNITTAIPLSHPRRRSSNRFPSPSKWSPMRKKLKSSAFSEGRELLRCLDPRQIGSRANE